MKKIIVTLASLFALTAFANEAAKTETTPAAETTTTTDTHTGHGMKGTKPAMKTAAKKPAVKKAKKAKGATTMETEAPAAEATLEETHTQ